MKVLKSLIGMPIYFPPSKKRWQANWTILTKERDIDVSKECRQAQPIPQYHCGIPGIAGNTGAGVAGVKKSVEQAVGSDIIFGS